MTNFRPIFENDWCGIETFLKDVLSPVFGEYEQGYDVLTNEPEVCEKAKNANITEIRHAATFDFFGSELKVFDITVGDNKKLENNKVGIQAIVRQYINQFEGALIIFHHQKVENQEWRFSYVEKRVNAKDSTSAKRYTYILGKGHPAKTISERFKDLESKKDNDEVVLLQALTNAFSIAPLSDDFFDEYREHYADLVEYISGKRFIKKGGKFVEEKTKNANGAFTSAFDGDDKLVRDFVKKMMGRLVFLHFLQKKGWLGVPKNAEWGCGDKNFIYNLFKNADEDVKKDFLEQSLEPLFFKTLNTDRGEEAFAPKEVCDIYGSKIRIPYLNGGLFEEDELDKKKVKFKKEHFEDLLEFFSQYNFTIDETDPDDQEIGVDPEMLGKIFENLLEDNKDKGAFYTPKEIVQYMCRESLIAYLEEQLKIENEELKVGDFVLKHDVSFFNEGEKASILKALLDVKVCDPAVGSGAFPMGMMNELLACTQLLTGKTKTRSELKKHIVKNNIYGVDIEKGAVDIARLRFWLAIIVDEEEPIPLPNLDYKIMQGNSLLESFNGIDLSDITKREVVDTGKLIMSDEENLRLQTNALIDAFEINMKEYFDTNDHKRKSELKKEINDFVKQRVLNTLGADCISLDSKILLCDSKITDSKSQLSYVIDKNSSMFKKLEKIISSNEEKKAALLKEKSTLSKKQLEAEQSELNAENYFLWHTWFGDVFNRTNDCNGFDIVIGNPPYVQLQDNGGKLAKIYEGQNFKTFARTGDLYCLFYEKGQNLLNKSGRLCFITSNKWMRAGYGEKLRDFFAKETNPKLLVDFAGVKVFESATVDTNILLFSKDKNEGKTLSCTTNTLTKDGLSNLSEFVRQNSSLCNFATSDSWVILSPIEQSIKQKIEAVGVPLKDWDINIYRGVLTGFNDAFIISGEKREEILNNCKDEAERKRTEELIRPILRGRDIKRYEYNFADLYLINTHNGIKEKNIPRIDIKDYPAVKKHLDEYWEKIEKRADQGDTPYNLRNCAYMDEFNKPKIVYPETTQGAYFVYDENGIMIDKTCFMLISENKEVLKYLQKTLSSKLFEVAYKKIFSSIELGQNGYQYNKHALIELPVIKHIIALSDKEEEIDRLVYQLYGLSEDEIKVVEGR